MIDLLFFDFGVVFLSPGDNISVSVPCVAYCFDPPGDPDILSVRKDDLHRIAVAGDMETLRDDAFRFLDIPRNYRSDKYQILVFFSSSSCSQFVVTVRCRADAQPVISSVPVEISDPLRTPPTMEQKLKQYLAGIVAERFGADSEQFDTFEESYDFDIDSEDELPTEPTQYEEPYAEEIPESDPSSSPDSEPSPPPDSEPESEPPPPSS